MFWHNFKYSVKTLLKNKILLFWVFAFPIVLGVFFHLAFQNIEKNEKLKIIDIGVVDDLQFQNRSIFKEALNTLSEKGENQMFSITYGDEEELHEQLEKKEITGYASFGKDDVYLFVRKSGINETIFRYVIDEIASNEKIINHYISDGMSYVGNENVDFNMMIQNMMQTIESSQGNIENVSNENLSYTMIEYYTLIAMACLYGGIFAMVIMNSKLANMNATGKRTAISSLSKGKLIISSLLASYIVQLLGIVLLFLFTIICLKVDYGHHLPFVILLSFVGCLGGLSLGIFVSAMFKKNENTKTGILIAFTMLGCFLSGMMGITMKYTIDKYIPILNKINPASMITDGFYSLYYYGPNKRFFFNIISILLFTIVLTAVSIREIRRQKYDSI